MNKIICPRCSVSGHVWIPLKTFVVSWKDKEPINIIYYYECEGCKILYSVSVPIVQERRGLNDN